jgi:hypothetical protein
MNASMIDSGLSCLVTIAKQPVTLDWRIKKWRNLLIAAEAARFDVLLTVDQRIEYQQNNPHYSRLKPLSRSGGQARIKPEA